MYFSVVNMIAQCYIKIASEDSWYFFNINTMNDSTFAFNFTRNHLRVHKDSLTAVRPCKR